MAKLQANRPVLPPIKPANFPIVVHRETIISKELRGKDGIDGNPGKDGISIDIEKSRILEVMYNRDLVKPLLYKRNINTGIDDTLDAGLYKISIFTVSNENNAMCCVTYNDIRWIRVDKQINLLSFKIDDGFLVPQQFILNKLFKNMPDFRLKCYIEAYRE